MDVADKKERRKRDLVQRASPVDKTVRNRLGRGVAVLGVLLCSLLGIMSKLGNYFFFLFQAPLDHSGSAPHNSLPAT